MSIQYVNTGSSANKGDGDSLRTAFGKINYNFSQLAALTGGSSATITVNSFPPLNPTEGELWFDIVSGRSFIYYDNTWVDSNPPAINPIPWTSVTSHILPGPNLTYDLGSTSSQWRSLYVGTSTIYLGGTALSIAGGSLTVDGSPVAGGGTATTSTLVNDSYTVSLSTTGNLTLPGIMIGTGNLQLASSQGSVDVGRYLRIRDGDIESHIHIDSPDNNTYDLIFGDDSKYIRVDHTGTVVIGNNNNANTWTFALDGSLTFPDGTTSTGATVFANSSSYKIQTISFGGSPSNVVSTFEFGVASMTIPGNGIIYNEGQEGYWALDGANKQFTFPNLSRISYGLGNAGLTVDDLKIQSVNTGNVVVSANGEDWVFNTTGALTFPDSTTQTTAYTGIASSGTTATSAAVGYIGMPQNNQTNTYTVAISDQGKHIYCTGTSFTVTIPANTVTSFPIGSSVAFIAGPTTTATIAIQTDTMYLGGSTGTSGTRSLSPFGMATAVKVAPTTWFISGAGLA